MTNTDIKMINNKLITGAKAGKNEQKPPNIAKDTVASLSIIKILYGLGEGEISGLVDGAKSIILEGTPLEDSESNKNFENVQYDFRAGTLDQDYIKGFPDVSNETPISVELRSGTDWIRSLNKPDLSAVRVRLSWNGLKKQDLKTGDVTGYKIEYAIDLKTGFNTYEEVLRTKIEDKVSGKYERTHRIDLPYSLEGWQIRVRRITPNANSELIADKMFIESYTEVIDLKLRYPHTALLGLQYDAKTFSNIAKVAIRCKGKLINIPSNYDTATGLYTGLWNGTYKLEYSNNPAWIFYDIITSPRYGLGKRVDKSMIDKWALYNLGVYCDGLVNDGKGGLEKRYTCNVYIQSQEDAFKILQQLAGIFRGLTFWNGEQIVLDADLPKDAVYNFNRANVIDGDFEYSGTRARDRHTVAKVAFDNPNQNFKTEYEYIRDEAAIAKLGINIVDISAIGCTSRGQAQRAGIWALKSEQLETRTVSFRTGLEGALVKVGDIIQVSDELLAGRVTGGRVADISLDYSKITLDRDVISVPNASLIINDMTGKAQKRAISSMERNTVNLVEPFKDIAVGGVWILDTGDMSSMKFKIMSIKQDDNIYSISAIQYEPTKYSLIDNGADVKQTSVNTILTNKINPPDAVIVKPEYRLLQGQTVINLLIEWSQVKEATAYKIEYRKDSGNWITLGTINNISTEIENILQGDYEARVTSIDAFNNYSNAATSPLVTVSSKASATKPLATLSASSLISGIELAWAFEVGAEDTAYTEIQVKDSLSADALLSLLGTYSYPTNHINLTGLTGGITRYYRGRTVDKLGNYSTWSNWIQGTPLNDPLSSTVAGQTNDVNTLSNQVASLLAKVNELEAQINAGNGTP